MANTLASKAIVALGRFSGCWPHSTATAIARVPTADRGGRYSDTAGRATWLPHVAADRAVPLAAADLHTEPTFIIKDRLRPEA